MIITFSGLDGSGKTTLIHHLEYYFDSNNIKFDSYSIYGDLSVYAFLRNLRSILSVKKHFVLDENKNKNKKIYKFFRNNNSKNFFLLFDIILIFFVKAYYKVRKKTLIIDRYFFDFIMEVSEKVGPYQKLLLFLFPSADISFFIETDPEISFKRKGEYDVATLKKRRQIYSEIFDLRPIDYFISNNNDSLDKAKSELIEIVKSKNL